MRKIKPFFGKWICAEEFSRLTPLNLFHLENEKFEVLLHDEKLKNYHMTVRKEFDAAGWTVFSDLLIRITADDYYKLYINDEFVGQGPAAGYYYRYHYNEFNISRFIHDGINRIEVQVYYQGLVNRVWNSADYRQGMIADILGNGKFCCLRTKAGNTPVIYLLLETV